MIRLWSSVTEARAFLYAWGLGPVGVRGRMFATCPACDVDRRLYLAGLTPQCADGCPPGAVLHGLFLARSVAERWRRFGRPTLAELADQRAEADADLRIALAGLTTDDLAAVVRARA
jgi:hypothetical protein